MIHKLMSPMVLILALTANVPTAHAAGVVTNCSNDADFSSKLAGGGSVTFNCGGVNASATIILSSSKIISAGTSIDGGGKITLSGDKARQLFQVNSGASLDVKNIVLENGSSGGGCGAIVNSGFLAMESVTVRGCAAAATGGAICSFGAADITSSKFLNNKASDAGAIDASSSTAEVTIAGSVLRGNQATGTGSHGLGGAIYVDGGATVNIFSSDINSNTAGTLGGGIYVTGTNSSLNLQGTSAVRNNLAFIGGGIYNTSGGTLTLGNATVSGNKMTAGGNSGGGISNYDATMTLTNVTLSGNITPNGGGGIDNAFSASNATLTDVTISGNKAGFAGARGGGFHNFQATATLTNVTIADNSDGGIFNSNDSTSHLNLTNVIIANNTNGPNCEFDKAPDSSNSNLSSDNTCGFGSGRDNVTVLLGPLETNGGLTLTNRLLPGSLAIDDGTSSGAPSTDQRGVTRPQGPAFDVGSVEFVPCIGKPTKPALVAPALNTTVKTTQVLLDWAGPDCATNFKVTVRQDSTSGTIVFSKSVFPDSQVTTTALTRGHSFFWQVKACDVAGCTAGDQWDFKLK